MQSDCEKPGVLKDFHFVTLVAFAYDLTIQKPKKKASKSVSNVLQKLSKTLLEIASVLETLPRRVWNDFGVPNGLPKEVLEASSRPSKTSSFQLGLPGGLWNGLWRPFGPLGAGF